MPTPHHHSFIDFFVDRKIPYQWIDQRQSILFLPDISLYIQWMSMDCTDVWESDDPNSLQKISLLYSAQGKALWRIWEDQWIRHFEMLSGRLLTMCGQFVSVYARKTQVKRISAPVAADFLQKYHLLSSVSVRYKYGLFYRDELISVACFSNPRRIIRKDKLFKSAELVRFACKNNYLVAGGMGKLIQSFCKDVEIDDLVTYADLDYTIGNGYRKLGFKLEALIPPKKFKLDSDYNRFYINHKRVQTNSMDGASSRIFYNGGGQKWILFSTLGTKI